MLSLLPRDRDACKTGLGVRSKEHLRQVAPCSFVESLTKKAQVYQVALCSLLLNLYMHLNKILRMWMLVSQSPLILEIPDNILPPHPGVQPGDKCLGAPCHHHLH